MTAKQYLKQIEALDRKVKSSIRLYDKCVEESKKYARPDLSAQDKLMHAAEQANADIDYFVNMRQDIIDKIKTMDSPSFDILFIRYVEYERNFRTIANKLGYSYEYTVHLHGSALREFTRRFLS